MKCKFIPYQKEFVFEKRSNYQTNIENTFNEFYNKIVSSYELKNIFISFRNGVHVTDLNLNNDYNTPTGFYTYPLISFKKGLFDNISESQFRDLFPYNSDLPYIYFCILDDWSNIITTKTTDSVLKEYVLKIKQLYFNIAPVIGMCDDFLNNKYNPNYEPSKSPTHKFWLFLYSIAPYIGKKKNDIFTVICNKIGVDGFVDYGTGFIHINEPKQAIFFKVRNKFSKIETYSEKQFSLNNLIEYISNGGNLKYIRQKYKFLSHNNAMFIIKKFPKEHVYFKNIDNIAYLIGKGDYEQISDFNNGIATVYKNKKYSFIKWNGERLTDLWFDNVEDLYWNCTIVKNNNKYNLLDKNGKLLFQKWFNYIEEQGLVNFTTLYKVELSDKLNFVDPYGSYLSNKWFDSATDFKHGYSVVLFNNQKYILNDKGDLKDLNGELIENANFKDKKFNTNKKFYNGDIVIEQITPFINGFSTVFSTDLGYNLLKEDNNILSKVWFKKVENFKNSDFLTNVWLFEEQKMWINKKGEIFDINKNKINNDKLIESYNSMNKTLEEKLLSEVRFVISKN